MTLSSAVGMPSETPKIVTSLERSLRKGIACSQPSTSSPNALTIPRFGSSMTDHTNATATTGDTYGRSIEARTRVLPRKGARTMRAATRPKPMASAVPTTL